MSDVIGIVLRMTLGLFVNKARSSLCDQLKDAGLNSQQLRNLIISKLQNIETKLSGLARADLLSSVSRFQEGLRLLGDLLDKSSTPLLPLQEDDDKTRENSTTSNESKSPVNVDLAFKLVEVIDELKRNSGDHFMSAMNLFDQANILATNAFHNEALAFEDRIMAAKLRLQSRLFYCLENPSLASQSCRLYLEELHGISPIAQDFRNYLEGGMASIFNTDKRRKLVLSVSVINLVVFKFLKSFTKNPINLYDWPNLTIKDDWSYNPLILHTKICLELQNAGIELPNLFVFGKIGCCDLLKKKADIAINIDGDFFVLNDSQLVKISNNEVKTLCHDVSMTGWPFAIAIARVDDNCDIMYLLHRFSHRITPTGTLQRLVSVFLTVFDSIKFSGMPLQPVTKVDKFENVICDRVHSTSHGFAILGRTRNETELHITFYQYNKSGITEPIRHFKIRSWGSSLTTISSKYQLVAVKKFSYHVNVYSEDGQLIRQFELYGGERESCVSIAFNYVTEELVFVSHVGHWFYLSTYDLTGQRHHKARLTLFGECSRFDPERSQYPRLTAHCNGPMAVISDEYPLHLQ